MIFAGIKNGKTALHRLGKAMLALILWISAMGVKASVQDSTLRYNYFFLEGIRQQEKGNLSAAFDLLNYALSLNPKASEAYYELAGYYVELKDTLTARDYFAKAAELSPENPDYQERVAQLYIATKNYDKAIEAYERLYASSKTRDDVLQILLQLYGMKNDYKKMIDVLDRVETLNGASEQLSLSKMQIYEQAGEKKKEYEVLRELVDKHPLELNYQVMLGNWLLQNDKKAEALKIYKEVLKDDPENASAKLSLLDYYTAVNDTKTTDALISELLTSPKTEFDTKSAIIRQAITSNLQSNSKDSTRVFNLFRRALSVPQQNADMYMLKAAYMTLLKMPKDSLNKVYEEALKVEPDNAPARLALIQNIWEKNDYDKVIELCKPAQEYNPEDMAFYYFQGIAQFQKHENDAALTTLRKGVSQIKKDSNPDIVSDFYAIMGDILHEKGLSKEAFEAYDSCLQWKPDNVGALNNYAYYLSIEGGDLQKAEQMSYKTVKAEPKNSTFLDTYAWILFGQKRYEEAKIYIDQAVMNDSTLSDVVLEHAGDIHAMANDMPKALDYWQQALNKNKGNALLRKKIELKKYIAQ